jgi:hypothetical protein
MVIENKLQSAKVRLGYIMVLFAIAFSAGYWIFAELPVQQYNFLIVAIALAFIYGVMFNLKLFYFYLSDGGNKIIIRFFNVHPFLGKYKSIEIPRNSIKDYEIEESIFKFKRDLIISIKTTKGIGKYPPISISALTKKEQRDLEEWLKKQKAMCR